MNRVTEVCEVDKQRNINQVDRNHWVTYLLTYLLHGAESFLRSWPEFAASQEIPRIFREPENSLPYSQVPTTCLYPEPSPSSPQDPLQLPEDPS
jgi:hypothetical protein